MNGNNGNSDDGDGVYINGCDDPNCGSYCGDGETKVDCGKL